MKIFDIGVPLEESNSDAAFKVEINRLDHVNGVESICKAFGCKRSDLPNELGWAGENVAMFSHAGTHVDAPWHYAPTSEGKKSRTIDQMPLEWFFNDGVILDMRDKPDGYGITTEDIKTTLHRIHYTLKPFDIVMLQTGADKYWGKQEYVNKGSGLIKDSTLWLIDQGIKVIGTDAWGLDRPFWAIRQEFERTHNKEIIWESHFAGIEKEYCQIEKLANLDMLPNPSGFKVACFPIKLKNSSAGWCRAVAII
jgi:kynurenine formamidase